MPGSVGSRRAWGVYGAWCVPGLLQHAVVWGICGAWCVCAGIVDGICNCYQFSWKVFDRVSQILMVIWEPNKRGFPVRLQALHR